MDIDAEATELLRSLVEMARERAAWAARLGDRMRPEAVAGCPACGAAYSGRMLTDVVGGLVACPECGESWYDGGRVQWTP